MRSGLRDVVRAFSLGEITLDMLRAAALAERVDRGLAERVLGLVAEWERSAWAGKDTGRSELRYRAKQLIPPEPPAPEMRRPPGESIYEAGIRGQRRRS